MPQWLNTTHHCMSKKNKRQAKQVPTNATARNSTRKDVVIKEPVSTNQLKPSWRFGRFDADCEEWGMSALTNNISTVLDCLKSYENCTWQQIKTMTHDKSGKTKNHPVDLDKLTKQARKRLNQIYNDDIENVCSLRHNNLFRVIGILQANIMYILWIDSKHEVSKVSS